MKVKNGKTHKNRLQRRAGRTRIKLKKAALDAFSQKSIDATTVEDITEKADVGKGTLYQHFEDKDEIVVTLVQEAVEHLTERMKIRERPHETLEGILEHILNTHYEFLIESREEFLLLSQGKVLSKLQSQSVETLQKPYKRYLKEIERLVSVCLPSPAGSHEIRGFGCAVAGFIFGFFSFAMIGMDAKEMESSFKLLRKVFVNSLCSFIEG
jgi:AcrR family transcriptional regulator